jgi:membrane dipeptidase
MIPVIDGHNDLAWHCRELRGYRVDGLDSHQPELHTDLPRLVRGGVRGQFWSVWVDPELRGSEQVTATLEQIDWVDRFIDAYPEALGRARTAADVRRISASLRTAGLIGVEGGAQIDGSLGVLRSYARAGARYMTLTWSLTTDWADSATDQARHGGLSDFGRSVVTEMNRIGMIVDLAHVSPATMRHALDVTTAPVMVSHSASLALCDHPRNVPDDVVSRIAADGGVVMCAFVPSFVSQARRDWVLDGERGDAPHVGIDDVADHLDHLREVGGIDVVGLGADYDGTGAMPSGLDDVSGYQRLLETLRTRGWSTSDLEAVAHANALRVLEANDEAHLAFMNGTAPAPPSSALTPAVDVDERVAREQDDNADDEEKQV